MLYYALVFFIIAILAALMGFGGRLQKRNDTAKCDGGLPTRFRRRVSFESTGPLRTASGPPPRPCCYDHGMLADSFLKERKSAA
jgi:hypothetical protein